MSLALLASGADAVQLSAADGAVGSAMSWLETVVLAIVQGLTEFLPISSSGHLRIVSAVFFGEDAGASFTAVTQLGTEAAVLVFFARDIVAIVRGWFAGLFDRSRRGELDYRMGWYVIVGTIPVGVLGFLFRDQIRTGARNLWLVATMLVVFSAVIAAAEYFGRKRRGITELTLRDGVVMGSAQALALIPGVSRSGGTISAGLFLGLNREAAARYSFLLAVPAVVASGLFSLPDAFDPSGTGMQASGAQLLIATIIAFVLGYASIAWLLKFVTGHSMYWFVGYRVVVGVAVLIALATGALAAT